jgi:hypothetical protein
MREIFLREIMNLSRILLGYMDKKHLQKTKNRFQTFKA